MAEASGSGLPGSGAGLGTVPPSAAAVFGGALAQAERYAELLAGPGVERGVVGPAEAERIWDRHLLNSAAIARLIPARCSLVDVGSGAGLPGIVLALLVPGARVMLVEPLARRVAFLEECVAELGLTNAEVVRARAEDLAGELTADVVVARAVAPLEKLAGLCLDLLRPGGKVIAIKGAGAEAELVRARPVLARLGVTDARVSEVASADGGAAATVVTFSAPQRRSGDVRGRAAGKSAGPVSGRRGGQRAGGPGGRRTMPNSRRGGG